jgi:hypothetical protein
MKPPATQELDAAVMSNRYVGGPLRALVLDLVNDDWSMALQDLEHLYRALKTVPNTDLEEPAGEVAETVGASKYLEDRTTVPVMSDRYVRGRIRAMVLDLVNDDWSMALQDLERLYRALKTVPSTDLREPTREVPEIVGASIYYLDDGTMVEEFCQGPDDLGQCPRAKAGRPVACAGKRLATRGWDFGVALDAKQCPLISLGLVRRPTHDLEDEAEGNSLAQSTGGG